LNGLILFESRCAATLKQYQTTFKQLLTIQTTSNNYQTMSNILILALIGALAGSLHVLMGPDHLAALAPFSAHRPGKSWVSGLWWGIGHTGSVWVIAVLALLVREMLPVEALSAWSERLVGVVLIGLGFWGIKKAMGSHLHYHEHEHDGSEHAHFHVHAPHTAHAPHKARLHRHTHAPVSIGVLHGMAGSSHLLGILPALALASQLESATYLLGFGIGSIVAITAFAWALGKLMQRFLRHSAKAYRWAQLGFSGAAVVVGVFWLIAW
jgi:ABC-type nickel/cobalt efflux system permease component RcnA